MHLADGDARASIARLDGAGNVGAAALDDAGAVRTRAQQGDLCCIFREEGELLLGHRHHTLNALTSRYANT